MKKISTLSWLTFFTGFCAMSYELILAQLWSVFSAETAFRYIMMFGLYILTFQGGYAFAQRLKLPGPLLCLLQNNIILNFLGVFSVIGLLRVSSLDMFPGMVGIMAVGLMILIGFWAGQVIFLIRHLSVEKTKDEDNSPSFDLGNFCAAIFFPLYIYSKLGLLAGAAFMGIVNAALGLGLFDFKKMILPEQRKAFYGYLFCQLLVGVLSVLIFINADRIYDSFLSIYLK